MTNNTPPKNLKKWEESSLYVNQGRHWSSALIWITSSTFLLVIIWAFTAKIDQTISARGRLQPSGSVVDVDSAASGIVEDVLVEDGRPVKKGQKLLSLKIDSLVARKSSLDSTKGLISAQIRSLQSVLLDAQTQSYTPHTPIPTLDTMIVAANNQADQLKSQLKQLSQRISSRRLSLKLQQQISTDMRPVFEAGGLSRIAYLTQLNSVQELEAEIASLEAEKLRIKGQASMQLSELNKQLLNTDSQLSTIQELINNSTLKAPISGIVFDLKASKSSFVSADQVLLKIVPSNRLEAVVDISNSDIGFVKVGMPATVSIDSFPSGEFGYLNGTLESIGSDALKPDPLSPAYRFPASISLRQQQVVSGSKQLNLQSGMAVTANIKLRARPAISVVTDIFTKQFEGVKRFR